MTAHAGATFISLADTPFKGKNNQADTLHRLTFLKRILYEDHKDFSIWFGLYLPSDTPSHQDYARNWDLY